MAFFFFNNGKLAELVAVTTMSALLCLTFIAANSRRVKDNDEVGPIVYEDDVALTEPDRKLWDGVKDACMQAASDEPLLERSMKEQVLRHPNLESSLSYILSLKLASENLPAADLKAVFDEVLLKKCRGIGSEEYPDAFQWPPREGKHDTAALIRSDLWAVKER